MAIVVKRGDTFSRTCELREDGFPIDISSYTIRSSIKMATGQRLSDFTIVKLTQANTTLGKFTITATYAATTLWRLGAAQLDVECTDSGGVRRTTTTVDVTILEDMTI